MSFRDRYEMRQENDLSRATTCSEDVDCFMSTPAIVVPPHIATSSDTLTLLKSLLPSNHPKLEKFQSIVHNTQVDKRHLARPLSKSVHDTNLELRQQVFEEIAPELAMDAAERAMQEVQARPEDIQAVVAVCATSPETMMPGLDQILISKLGLPATTRGYPVAQWGCRGGAAGLNLAKELCLANPKRNVLVVTVELCSLLYQPADLETPRSPEEQQAAVICDALFADAAGACVICGTNSSLLGRPWHHAVRMGLKASGSYQLPKSLDYMKYETSANGLHFRLTNEVPKAMNRVAPVMIDFLKEQGMTNESMREMSFLLHTGGPKVLLHFMQAVHRCCASQSDPMYGPDDPRVSDSMSTLQAHGNVASVSLLATVRGRMLDGVKDSPADACLIAGCGPGMGADWVVGSVLHDPFQPKPKAPLKIKDAIQNSFHACFVGNPSGRGGLAAIGLAALFTKHGRRSVVVDAPDEGDDSDEHITRPDVFVHSSAGDCGQRASEILDLLQHPQAAPRVQSTMPSQLNSSELKSQLLDALESMPAAGSLCHLYHAFEYRGVAAALPSSHRTARADSTLRVIAKWSGGGAGLYELQSGVVVDCDKMAGDDNSFASLLSELAPLLPPGADLWQRSTEVGLHRSLDQPLGIIIGQEHAPVLKDVAAVKSELSLPMAEPPVDVLDGSRRSATCKNPFSLQMGPINPCARQHCLDSRSRAGDAPVCGSEVPKAVLSE